MQEIGHWINGKRVAGTSGRFADVMNPATGEVQARVALAEVAHQVPGLDGDCRHGDSSERRTARTGTASSPAKRTGKAVR